MTGIEDLYNLVIGAPKKGIAGVDLSGSDEEYLKLLNQMSEKLNGNVSQEIENEIEDLQIDMISYNERCSFKAGFKVGVLLMTEVFAHE